MNTPPTSANEELDETEGALAALLATSIVRTHNRLAPFLGAALKAQNLTAAQLNALLSIQAAGAGGLLMSELGDQLVVTRPNVTGLVDRLERQALVERAAHRDRRATVIRLTDRGRQVLEQALPAHEHALSRATSCLSAEEQRTLIALLSRLRRALKERTP
jgi:MarR family 2-MHQ and catechol resistance regulon transcriptional repressor